MGVRDLRERWRFLERRGLRVYQFCLPFFKTDEQKASKSVSFFSSWFFFLRVGGGLFLLWIFPIFFASASRAGLGVARSNQRHSKGERTASQLLLFPTKTEQVNNRNHVIVETPKTTFSNLEESHAG